jgi:hypothetical protein
MPVFFSLQMTIPTMKMTTMPEQTATMNLTNLKNLSHQKTEVNFRAASQLVSPLKNKLKYH